VLYADAGRVAALLQRILARRRTLAFAAAEVDGVAAVLASHQPSVEAAAADVVTAAGSW
jgi:primosomal protein N'